MNRKNIFLLLTLTKVMFFTIESAVFGQVTAKYNQFKGQTTLNLIGEQNKEKPIFCVWSQFEGSHPDPSDIL